MCNGRANGYLSPLRRTRFSLSYTTHTQCARPLCKFACPFHGKWTEMLIISNIHYILEISVLLLRSLLLLMLHYNDHQHDEVVKYAASKHHHPRSHALSAANANAFGPSGINQQHERASRVHYAPLSGCSACCLCARDHTHQQRRERKRALFNLFPHFWPNRERAARVIPTATAGNNATQFLVNAIAFWLSVCRIFLAAPLHTQQEHTC